MGRMDVSRASKICGQFLNNLGSAASMACVGQLGGSLQDRSDFLC